MIVDEPSIGHLRETWIESFDHDCNPVVFIDRLMLRVDGVLYAYWDNVSMCPPARFEPTMLVAPWVRRILAVKQ